MPIEHVQQYRRIYGQSLHMIMMKWGAKEGLGVGVGGSRSERSSGRSGDETVQKERRLK